MENGKATLCESDESMTVYYDCAFENEANAIAYAASLNDRWNNNSAMHGWTGKAEYFAAPLPEGCKPEWIDGEESETETAYDHAIAQASKAFGHEIVNAFLDCPSRDRFAFVQSLFNSNPIAACVLHAIDESIINANDDHGRAVWSKAWDDCFAATLDCWLDDWSMIEHSGIARIDWEIWQEIGNRIHAYHRGELQTVETLAEIKLNFWNVELLLAEDAFRANPTESNKIALLEIAEIRFAMYRARVLEIYSNAKENGGN